MDLIIGGRAQGKLDYALAYYSLKKKDASTRLSGAKILCGLQDFIRADIKNAARLINEYIEKYPDCIIICDEVGCGIIPIDKEEREYREETGRICCGLAAKARRVHRVVCGIGRLIKDG